MGLKGIYEALFYTNLNTGELIPWQAESYTYNDDFTEVTLKLRDGVTWCDGTKFTADDVKFTLEMLRDNPTLILRDRPTRSGSRRSRSRPTDGGHQPEQARPAVLPRQPGPRSREPPGDDAEAHLGGPGLPRPSPTSTWPRAGRAAPVPTRSCRRPPSSRSPTASTPGGASRPASRRTARPRSA